MGNTSIEQYELLTDYDESTAYSEAFHTLYANIRLNWKNTQSKLHSLLLTAPTPYAGQATVASNLAIVVAQSGTPIVLVDADLRMPCLQQRFGLAKSPGLSDLLIAEELSQQDIEAALQPTFIPHLRILGAGNVASAATKLLLSSKLEALVEEIRHYLMETEIKSSVLLFHSPAVLSGADASLLGATVEQTFLTIIQGRTTRGQAKQAQEQLQRAHANLAGVVMLDV